jgi:hypothetical protein
MFPPSCHPLRLVNLVDYNIKAERPRQRQIVFDEAILSRSSLSNAGRPNFLEIEVIILLRDPESKIKSYCGLQSHSTSLFRSCKILFASALFIGYVCQLDGIT